MLRIRRVQERINDAYLDNNMHTPVHLYTGQEAIAVGVCAVLHKDDAISSNHRGHGHYLAKGGDLAAMIAELHGRATGCAQGYGGSMHLIAPEVGHLGSSSIVGGGIPIGTGHALAFALRREKRVSAVFLGDGASEEGVFYESCNFAILKRLPVVFILENNGWSVCSPLRNRECTPNVFHKGVDKQCLFTCLEDGNDVEKVYRSAFKAVEWARSGNGPAFIEYTTYRIAGHAGCQSQDVTGYRDPEEIEDWRKRCPVNNYMEKLLEQDLVTKELCAEWEEALTDEITAAFDFALSSPFPEPLTKSARLFCE